MTYFKRNEDLDLACSDNGEKSIGQNEPIIEGNRTLVEKIDAFEKNLIILELTRTKGNVKKTYLALGLPRKTFYDKMNKHGLKRKDFVEPPKPTNNRSALL